MISLHADGGQGDMNRSEGRGLRTTAFPSLFTVLDVETD